jgi:hypothetical protein
MNSNRFASFIKFVTAITHLRNSQQIDQITRIQLANSNDLLVYYQ